MNYLSKLRAKDILNLLDDKFDRHRYQICNTYIFPGWESDWFSVSPQNHVYEIEVKVNKFDFRADFKKHHRHSILQSTSGLNSRNCPNKFYFCAPDKLIDPNEVPEYAGLLVVRDTGIIECVKNARLLHEDRSSLSDVLVEKFYYRNRNLVRKIRQQEQNIEFYTSEKYHMEHFPKIL